MKFNIAYLGAEGNFHLRRDFILLLQNSLTDLGHDVNLSGWVLDAERVNLLIGAYKLRSDLMHQLAASNVSYVNINTEIISDDMLNFNPKKVDLLGAYVPMMASALASWDVVLDNLNQYSRYGLKAHFLRWGYHPSLCEIRHKQEKDLDFYFFGTMSSRRKQVVDFLFRKGLKGYADNDCPYFLRNDRISRAKVQLNLVQDEKYTHVNSFRICYLANNNCFIMSEKEHDPANYLQFCDVFDNESLFEAISFQLEGEVWKSKASAAFTRYKSHVMRDYMEELLDQSLLGCRKSTL